MSHTVKIELSDKFFVILDRQAKGQGTSPSALITRLVESQVRPPVGRQVPESDGLRRFFGRTSNDSKRSSNSDIDADLVRAYANEE